MVVSLSIAGCTTSTTSTTDYTDLYNKNSGNNVVKPFYKTTSDRGNDLYVGVTRSSINQSSNITIEHVKSQDEAAKVFVDTVAAYKSDGYTTRPTEYQKFNITTDRVEWQGDKYVDNPQRVGWGTLYNAYVKYEYGSAVHSWLVVNEHGEGVIQH